MAFRLLTPTRWQHGDTALMCLATSQIGYSWIMRPSTLPPSYVNFLNRHGGNPLHNYAAVRVRRPVHALCKCSMLIKVARIRAGSVPAVLTTLGAVIELKRCE